MDSQQTRQHREFFLAHRQFPHPTLDPAVANLFLKYDWPGNVRELQNVLERAVILSGGEPLSLEEFSLEVDSEPLVGGSTGKTTGGGLESTEKEMILAALASLDLRSRISFCAASNSALSSSNAGS